MYLFRMFQFILMITGILGRYEKIYYLSLEHTNITYMDKEYGTATQVARRYSRSDPVYYFSSNFTSYVWFGNNFTMHYFFYEFLSNTYKRGFVEMHFGICDLIHKNKYFGNIMQQGKLAGKCPYPPGNYELINSTLPTGLVTKAFPFTKGRIYVNVTFGSSPDDKIIFSSYVDMEVKEIRRRKRN